MEKNFRPVLSIRIFGDEKCFGPGIATLLRNVQKEGSLRAAAIAMEMAYSKAWTVIKASEAQLGFKLLESTTGGKHGGGAHLSPEAEKILTAYDNFCKKLRKAAAEEFEKEFSQVFPKD